MSARNALRPEFTETLPRRMRALAIDARGYPVPWFVASFNGKPDFRVIDAAKFTRARKFGRCWICGESLGVNKALVVGPMCVVNRTAPEPPSHLDCAEFAARFCPFLANPHAQRRDAKLPAAALTMHPDNLTHNPSVVAVWHTRTIVPFHSGGGVLFRFGDPLGVTWYHDGREATRDEVVAAFRAGFPTFLEQARARGVDVLEADALLSLEEFLPQDACA